MDLDQDLVVRIKGLNLEFRDQPQSDLLIPIPNANKDVVYEVVVTSSEFTSLCPLHVSQPDYATITVRYTPNEFLVELKSLKFYLVSFRQCLMFHEEVPAIILKALVDLLSPEELEVVGVFTTRGGLGTTVTAYYWEGSLDYSKEEDNG